jgi:uncharacterized protein (UPF0210 family)
VTKYSIINIQAIDENKDIEEVMYTATNAIDKNVKEIALDFAENFSYNIKSETTFIDRFVLPFIKKAIRKTNLVYSM